MRSDEWELVKQIFDTALALPQSERSAYIEQACAGNPQHLAIVTDLLSNHYDAGRFLETVSFKLRPVFSPDDVVAARFRIIRPIGDGGMGEVYEAFDERLRVRVALKTLHSDLTANPAALERFRREILVAREVSHESVCKIFDLVEHTNPSTQNVVPCLTMQLVQGESLLKFLQTRRPLPPEEALPLIRQIAAAMDTLHAHGIVHRDLKPSNIMLASRNGAPLAVVTDFGLAKPISHNELTFFESRPDSQAGAPYFMAPELLRDGRPSFASDVYSLGLIIDEMVTASRAFPAESLHGLYYQKLWEAPIPPTARSSSLNLRWDNVILRCLDTEPTRRYHSAADVVAELEGRAISSDEKTPSSPKPPSRRNARRRWLLAAGSTVLLISALLPFLTSIGTPPDNSVDVFPIDNLSNRADLEYVCRGIGSELMRRLNQIDGIQVIPYYEPRAKAKLDQLKGHYSLEGFIGASGDRIRLTAALTDNRSGRLLWNQNFERNIQDPLDLQSDIAEGSVDALRERSIFSRPLALGGASPLIDPLLKKLGFFRMAIPPAATTNPVAFDHYVRGLQLFEERTVPAALDAIKCYQDALREDPKFALADSALADAQFVLSDYEYLPLKTLLDRARHYANEAIRLDKNLAEPYAALASVQQSEGDFKGAEQSFQTAIRLNPRFARGHRWFAGLLIQFARINESLGQMRRSIELDPYDYPAQSNNGLFLTYAHHFPEAAQQLEDVLKHKELNNARQYLGDTYADLARASSGSPQSSDYLKKAIQQADLLEASMLNIMARIPPTNGMRSIKYSDRMHAEYYTLTGLPAKAQPYLARVIADTEAGRISPVNLATVYATTGKDNEALNLLEKAAQQNDRQLLFLRVAPEFDHLHNNPRFEDLLRKLHLI